MGKNELQKLQILRLSARESNKITKECICTAFLILLEAKKVEEISITELVERAGVSRSSFYRNYKSKEDVFNDISNTLIAEIKAYLKEYQKTDKTTWYSNVFYVMKENLNSLPFLMRPELLKMFLDQKSFIDILNFNTNGEKSYFSVAAAGAFANIIFYWINTGMVESIEEMTQICLKLENLFSK